MKNQVIQGDCLTKLKTLDENSVDSIVTDPPYELGFMGKSWDNTGIANNKEMWAECLRVLKPGGHLLSFGGTRTYHRMAVAIEDAGFEVRDMIEWVYGSGFPKSLNIGKSIENKILTGNASKNGFHKLEGERREGRIGMYDTVEEQGFRKVNPDQLGAFDLEPTTDEAKQWNGWGTALKPAHEPICMARKPLAEKTVAENCLKYGTGGINIDESRVAHQSEADRASATPQGKATSNTMAGSAPDVEMSEVDYNGEKYWYKNEYKWLVDKWLDDADYVWSELKENLETYDWCKVPPIESGDRVLFDSEERVCIRLWEIKRKEFNRPDTSLGRFPANLIHDNSEEIRECFPEVKGKKPFKKLSSFNFDVGGEHKKQKYESQAGLGETGNASRFFKSIIYQAKASKSERNKGCEGLPLGEPPASARSKPAEGRENALGNPRANNHPTVKPIALMEYLIKMVTPKGGIVLDPFAGSGSTLVAAKQNGYKYIGIELTPEYIDIINARLK